MPYDGPAGPSDRRELWIGVGCALLVLAIWTGYVLLTRLGTRTAFTPPDLLALRVGIAGVIMAPWFLRHGFGGLTPARAVVLALTAGVGFGGLSFTALSLAPAAHGAVLMTGSLPLYTSLLAMLILRERFGRAKLAGLALIVGGVLLMGYGSLSQGEAGQWQGDVLFVAASISWAVYSVLAQRWHVRPLQAATVVYVVSAVLYLPIYVLVIDSKLAAAPLGELLVQSLLQGVLATLVSIFAFMRVVQALGASSATMLTAAAPGVMTVLAIPLLGEVPGWVAVAGVCLVTAGIGATILALQPRRA